MAENVDNVNAALPLRGAVLCCTALTQDVRNALGEVATEMGAVCKLDLTSDVTHLFVGDITTPKYRYVAKERPDIKVLHPAWIDAVRQQWLNGDDVDVTALEFEHRLPAFFNLQICVTGFVDHDERAYLADTVQGLGAAYHGDLTRAVTHLIAAAPEGAKYTHAKQWGIKIVSGKWFKDSVTRGMALDESLYDPVMALEMQGQGAFRDRARPRPSLGKRERDGESQDVDDVGKRKYRRTTSTRLNSQSQDLWQDMSARETAQDTSETDQWREDEPHVVALEGDPLSSDARSYTRPERPKTFVRKSDVFPQNGQESRDAEGLFAGLHILIHGFDKVKTARLQQFLEPNGACIVQSSAELHDASRQLLFKQRYLLIPHVDPETQEELPEVPSTTKVVTEWWVERCVHSKQVFDPSDDPLSQPFRNARVAGLEGSKICTTGFPSVDFRQIAEAVKLMGAKYEEELTPSVSVLISASSSVKKEKAFYASKHSIPVVTSAWLWTCRQQRTRVPFKDFEVRLPPPASNHAASETSSNSPASSDKTAPRLNGRRLVMEDASRKRLSNTRKRHATPSLPLQASAPSVCRETSHKPQPFVHEDDLDGANDDRNDDGPVYESDSVDPNPRAVVDPVSPRRSQPLQDLSPNKSPNKSPRKSSQRPKQEADIAKEDGTSELVEENRPSRTITPAAPSPTTSHRSYQHAPPRPQHELAADLASLMHRGSASRRDSGSSDIPQKRKNRPLGRSTSGIGNRSGSASVHSDYAASPPLKRSMSVVEQPPPGTQLGYETADAELHRLQINKLMGIDALESGEGARKTVASVGLVKDSGGDGGVGSRVGRKMRAR